LIGYGTLSAVLLAAALRALSRAYALTALTEATTARVLQAESVSPPGRSRWYYRVGLQFRTRDGRAVEATVRTRSPQAAGLAAGAECGVVYLPGDPAADCWLGDHDDAQDAARRAVTAPLMGVVSGGLFAGVLLGLMYRERDLARRGTVATGCVIEAGERRGAKGGIGYWLRYEFRLPSGLVLQGRASVAADAYVQCGQVGSPLLVLWDPGRPRRHQPVPALRFVTFPPSPAGASRAEGGTS
jgi:hypothetical protein